MDLEQGKSELAKMGIFPSIRLVTADPVRRRGALIGTIKNPGVSSSVRARAVEELKNLIRRHPELDKMRVTIVTEASDGSTSTEVTTSMVDITV